MEGLLNNCLLTYVSSDINDPELITPTHLLYGKKIVSLPHSVVKDDEICDPDFGDALEYRRRAKAQIVMIINTFGTIGNMNI